MKRNTIAVSIIVPVYNAEKFLEKCLNSIVNQTLENIEIIIIDDGSIDNSSEICKKYARTDARIIYKRKENEGLAAARQDGIECAKGEYVGFVDSDDWVELNMFERMYEVACNEMADIVFCNCYFDDYEKDKIHLEPGIYNREDIKKYILPRTLSGISENGSNSVIRWSNCLRLYRLNLLNEHNVCFDRRFRRSQDLQLTFESTLLANKYVSITDEYLYHNRTEQNNNSLSRGYTKNYWELICPLIDTLYRSVYRYEDLNLKEQMDLCTFFFAATGIKNEYENKSNNIIFKIKRINAIINDERVENILKYIEETSLNEYYYMLYKAMLSKNKYIAYLMYFRYDFIKKRYKPFIRKIRKWMKKN